MRAKRLPVHPAQRIDRARSVTFTFAGRPFTGFAGDSVGSALHAAGVRILSRSFKYHRPRGLLCCRGHCPNCLVNVDGVPNVRACVEPLREGQRVEPQHAWPSLEWDALAILDRLHFLFPVGFYYKTFIHPRRLWPAYERVLRWFAGLGRISFPEEPPGEYERAHLFADVAVVGGGAAGMAGALEAARWGASVVLVDDQPELGGRWRLQTRAGAGERAGWEVARELGAQITAAEGIRVLTGATAFGLYEDNLLGVLEGNRLVRLRARQVIVATGGFEYPMVFENNDLPGVMLGGAAWRLQTLYGVRPGRRAVVVAGDDRGAELALELQAAGVGVQALADARAEPEAAAAGGIPVLAGHTVLAARGSGRVTHAVLGDLRSGGRREIECDLLCLTTGFEPAAGLIGQAGGRLRAAGNGSVTLGELPPGVLAAGEVTGLDDLSAIIASGRAAGARAALALSGPSAQLTARVEELDGQAATGPAAARRYVSVAPGQAAKRFVCLCEDVTAKDLAQAVAEGFDHIETLKRYTTVTMGPCQGKMCHRLSVDLCASLTGRTLDETGATTARPPAQPVPLGALAARQADPVKLTPMHHQHVEAGAWLMDMGPWKRPLAYGSVDEECRAVHEAVGLIDVSTLGKLEVAGRDGGAFLDWLHPNRFSDMEPGRVRYRVMCDEVPRHDRDGHDRGDRAVVRVVAGGKRALRPRGQPHRRPGRDQRRRPPLARAPGGTRRRGSLAGRLPLPGGPARADRGRAEHPPEDRLRGRAGLRDPLPGRLRRVHVADPDGGRRAARRPGLRRRGAAGAPPGEAAPDHRAGHGRAHQPVRRQPRRARQARQAGLHRARRADRRAGAPAQGAARRLRARGHDHAAR